jgi:hypothetical protein
MSRQRKVRTAIICVGALLLMAVGLYLGLSRQENGPAEGHHLPAPLPARVAAV